MKEISLRALAQALQAYRPGLTLESLHPVNVGCRNSNYVLRTDRERLFLRLTDARTNNERMAYDLLRESIRMPALLLEGELDGERFLLYEHIEGQPLQRHIAGTGICSPAIAAQAGAFAARLHALDAQKMRQVDVFTPPPFETWYELFLQNPNAREALGAPLIARVQEMLMREEKSIKALASEPSVPIHADFRPANMLIDARGQVYIVDWENFGLGHALGDVGQFFRFRDQFSGVALASFEQAYNAEAARPLPEDWERRSLLRDLVNPLQMLGRRWDAPRAKADLIALVRKTLEVLET